MKFGIFYELQLPKPWDKDSELNLFQNALTQIELADKLGYDHAWEVEHHFLAEYSHSPAPEVFLGAASQRTKQIRLGHAIIQLPTNHPARVAEKVATLDLLSRGRAEMGIGEGASPIEYEPFGVKKENKRAMWEDAVRCIIPMFKNEPWEYKGPHYDFPLRNVVPKSVQKPHPPLWVACSQLEMIEYAGRRGIGALGFQFVSPEAADAWVHAYYNNLVYKLDKLCDYQINPNIALVNNFMCAETDEEAVRRSDGITFFAFALSYLPKLRERGVKAYIGETLWDAYETWKKENPGAIDKVVQAGLIGSPETIAKKLRIYSKSHVDQIILLNQAGKIPHQYICDSLELFAKEVMPEFHALIPAQEEWKRDVLAKKIKLEEIDVSKYYIPTQGRDNKYPGAPDLQQKPAAE